MSTLELKKKQVELKKVDAAKSDMELKVLEREEDIARIKSNIEKQDERILELKAEIAELEGK